MSTPPAPITVGPCDPSAWVSGSDVAACFAADCENPSIYDTVAAEASTALYEISGRRFPGECTATVRPCRDGCGCWGGSMSSGVGPWYWTASYGVAPSGWLWGWRSECEPVGCGCGSTSRVRLAGYPVTSIVEVLIDGDVLDAVDAGGNPNYRLDSRRFLTRMDDPNDPEHPRRWPECQNLSLDETQPGTFAVTYTWGASPPKIAQDAAIELAVELFKGCSNQACQIPNNAIRIQRQGVTIERNVLLAFLDPSKPTGMVSVDIFLASRYGPRQGRIPAVWSPDVQPFAERVG